MILLSVMFYINTDNKWDEFIFRWVNISMHQDECEVIHIGDKK